MSNCLEVGKSSPTVTRSHQCYDPSENQVYGITAGRKGPEVQ